MNNLKITFLGTGNAIPTEKRNHTGILISFADESFLFDCGEGIQRQFRVAKLSPSKLTSIFLTHLHGDHILGLPGLLQTLAMSGYQKTLHIYGPKGIQRMISLIQELINRINISIEVHEIGSGKLLDKKDFYIESSHMNHGIPSLAYSLIIKEKIRLDKKKLKKLKLPNSHILKNLAQGKDIIFNNKKIKSSQVCYKEKGKKISIVMDTAFNENAINLSKNSDLLICESTFSNEEEKLAEEYKHLTASQAAQIAKKASVKKLILTHISQRYEHTLHIIEKEAKKTFKNTLIAKDFDTLEI